jgi:polyphenol oxidase
VSASSLGTASSDTAPGILVPDWPAPQNVRAAFTLRSGGVSPAPFDSLNVGVHVGDAPAAVRENRRRVREQLHLPAEPTWIEQVHGTGVAELDALAADAAPGGAADAVFTRHPRRVCAVQVADCMPVLLAARDGSCVAAVHAGWRGLAAGVLEATLRRLGTKPSQLMAWLGPAIGLKHFEVGSEVRDAFVTCDPGAAAAFSANSRGRWQCDLAGLARRRLSAAGITAVSGGQWCTYADATRFFSYRRDGQCGRMAALIWLAGAS